MTKPSSDPHAEKRPQAHLAAYLPRGRWLMAGIALLAAIIAILALSSSEPSAPPIAPRPMQHPAASAHLPFFITPPGATDVLLVVMAFVLVGAVLAVGVLFFWLHSLPERMVHNSTKVHFDIVAVLGLLSLFTHMHVFWIAALLLALIKIPDFSMPDFSGLFGRMANSLEKMADEEESKKSDAPIAKAVERPLQR
jgi:hypothetical protein